MDFRPAIAICAFLLIFGCSSPASNQSVSQALAAGQGVQCTISADHPRMLYLMGTDRASSDIGAPVDTYAKDNGNGQFGVIFAKADYISFFLDPQNQSAEIAAISSSDCTWIELMGSGNQPLDYEVGSVILGQKTSINRYGNPVNVACESVAFQPQLMVPDGIVCDDQARHI